MAKSKKCFEKQIKGIKDKIAKLEETIRLDPLHKKYPGAVEELEKLKKKLEE